MREYQMLLEKVKKTGIAGSREDKTTQAELTSGNAGVEDQVRKYFEWAITKPVEFIEPYVGKKGSYPAELFSETGLIKIGSSSTIQVLVKLCGIRDDEVIYDFADNSYLSQVIFKTDEAVKKFKYYLNETYPMNVSSFGAPTPK